MLAKSMGDLNDSANGVMTDPFHARNGKAVCASKLKSRWLTHMSDDVDILRSQLRAARIQRARYSDVASPFR